MEYGVKNEDYVMIKDLQTKLLSMGHSGCLALCYLYMIGIDPEELVYKYDELVENKIMTEDCYILDGDKFIKMFGSNKKVKRVDLNDTSCNLYIAYYKFQNIGHFVVVDKNNNIVFNSFYDSVSVKYGNMVEKRTLV